MRIYYVCVFVGIKPEYILYVYIYICHQGEDKSCLKHAKTN